MVSASPERRNGLDGQGEQDGISTLTFQQRFEYHCLTASHRRSHLSPSLLREFHKPWSLSRLAQQPLAR